MGESDFQTLLDKIDAGQATVLDICNSYNKQDPPPEVKEENFNNHSFFTTHFPTALCNILEQWFSDGTLDENQQETFRACSKCLLGLTKQEVEARLWLNQQAQLIDLTEKCLNEIGSYGYYIGVGGIEDPSLESFNWVVQAFEKAECHELFDELVKCVSCRFYTDAFYQLNHTEAQALTITQQFLLITCPNYLLTCDTNKSSCLKVVNKMLGQYYEMFAEFLPDIKSWTMPVVLCLSYPIRFTLSSIRSLSFEQKQLIYEVIIRLLLQKASIDPKIEQARVTLILKSLSLLIEIMRSDKDLADRLKNKSEKKSELIDILTDISKNEPNDDIKLKAIALISLLVPESEFSKNNKPEEVTELFVKNLNTAVEDGIQKEVDDVLSGLKDLVQNDAVQQEVVKQDGLKPIMKYAKETKDNPLPLKITYAMAFNADAKKIINDDKEFVDHIKSLQNSEKGDISKIAHGIVWRLEGEEEFKNKQEEKSKIAEEIKTEANDGKKNDMMISYCWAQKELCHKINDRLEKDGYKVWLDRDEMHGSIIERMAEAIEQSRIVLICMSSNYKNSINCKAEAEYAFSRKSKIVPLVVEPKYSADGWLGFMAGSKIYVNFADKDDEEFEVAYQLLVGELKANGLTDEEKAKETDNTSPTEKETKPEEKIEEPEPPSPPPIQTTEYLNVGPASVWNDENVKEFLTDNQLEQLIPICESMDGETLLEFHRSCETVPDRIYALINNPKEERPVSVATFFKFISRLKKFLPPKTARKVHFQYNFVYPPPTTSTEAPTDKANL